MSSVASSREHICAELSRVYLRARLRVPLRADMDASAEPAPSAAALEAALAEVERDIAALVAASGGPLPLARLAARYGLSRFDVDALLLSMLPAVDVRFERAFAALQDNPSRTWPTVDLVLAALCRSPEERMEQQGRFDAGAPLVRHRLIEVFSEAPSLRPSLLAHQVSADPRVVAYLFGRDDTAPPPSPHARLVHPAVRLADLSLPEGLGDRLLRFARLPSAALYLQGRPGSGRRSVAEGLCAAQGRPLLVVDAEACSAGDAATAAQALARVGREAFFRDAAVLLTEADVLFSPGGADRRGVLREALSECPGLVMLSGTKPWEPAGDVADRPFVRVEMPDLPAADQRALWRREVSRAAELAPDADLESLTGTYRLTPGQIRDAARAAVSLAVLRGGEAAEEGNRPVVTGADLGQGARRCSNRHLTSMGRMAQPSATWDDLVLPPDCDARLREICAHVRHRGRVMDGWGFERKLSLGKGVTALLAGPPGTGKTMAAGVVARELGLAMYQVDLSLVLSKYIGETEQHLGRLFDEAEASNALLFFDEADTLFGKRTEVRDAHDRNANLESSYMLQRLESYEGVAILASNFTKNMDEAFMRRFRFIVELPFPDEDQRLRIWQGLFPKEAPLDADLDYELLARRIDLTGGHLRNIALCAAFFAADEGAPVAMRHVLRAARGEYRKLGKVLDSRHLSAPKAAL